jgi:pyroglutamyl-peptidase
MKILVTGFKPFLGERINPSEMLATELAENFPEVSCLILPVEFKKSFDVLKSHLEKNNYDYLISLGQASARSKICLEKIGLNWVQTEHKDESGSLPTSGKIAEGPLALMSEFPLDTIYKKLKEQNFPVEISFSAGTYVCNDLYFRTLNEIKNTKSVFIHVPLIEAQSDGTKLFLPYSDSLTTISAVISSLLAN